MHCRNQQNGLSNCRTDRGHYYFFLSMGELLNSSSEPLNFDFTCRYPWNRARSAIALLENFVLLISMAILDAGVQGMWSGAPTMLNLIVDNEYYGGITCTALWSTCTLHAFICICVFNCCLYIVVYIDLLLTFTWWSCVLLMDKIGERKLWMSRFLTQLKMSSFVSCRPPFF